MPRSEVQGLRRMNGQARQICVMDGRNKYAAVGTDSREVDISPRRDVTQTGGQLQEHGPERTRNAIVVIYTIPCTSLIGSSLDEPARLTLSPTAAFCERVRREVSSI